MVMFRQKYATSSRKIMGLSSPSSLLLLLMFFFITTTSTMFSLFFITTSDAQTTTTTTAAPKPTPQMTWQAWVCVVSVVVVLLLLFTGLASCCATMFSVTLFLVLTGILSTKEFLSGLSNSGVCTVSLLYIVVGPLTQLPKVRQVIQYAISASKKNEDGKEGEEEE